MTEWTLMGASKPPCLSGAWHRFEVGTTTLGITANVVLAFFIIFCTEEKLQPYSRVLMCGCFVDLIYTLSSCIFEIDLDIRDGIYVIVSNGLFNGSFDFRYAIICFQVLMIYFVTAMISVPITFRGYIMTTFHVLGMATVVLVVASSVPTTMWLLWKPLSEQILRENSSQIRDFACHDAGEVHTFHLKDVFTMQVLPTLMTATLVVTFAYVIVIFGAIRIHRTVANSPYKSDHHRQRETQLNYAIFVQVFSPLLLIILPIIGAISAVFTGIEELRVFLVACTSVLSIVPVLNPISALLLIRSYRRSLLGILRKAASYSANRTASVSTNSIEAAPYV